jgi:hypothetical protein
MIMFSGVDDDDDNDVDDDDDNDVDDDDDNDVDDVDDGGVDGGVDGDDDDDKGFSPGSPVFLPPQKSTFLNSNSIMDEGHKFISSYSCHVLPS